MIKNHAAEDRLMIGTDYGHADSSTELEALTTLKKSRGITPETHKKLVDDNPRALYGLGPSTD